MLTFESLIKALISFLGMLLTLWPTILDALNKLGGAS